MNTFETDLNIRETRTCGFLLPRKSVLLHVRGHTVQIVLQPHVPAGSDGSRASLRRQERVPGLVSIDAIILLQSSCWLWPSHQFFWPILNPSMLMRSGDHPLDVGSPFPWLLRRRIARPFLPPFHGVLPAIVIHEHGVRSSDIPPSFSQVKAESSSRTVGLDLKMETESAVKTIGILLNIWYTAGSTAQWSADWMGSCQAVNYWHSSKHGAEIAMRSW